MIFIYPDRKESLVELSICCKNLDLPRPICWYRTELNSQIKNLLSQAYKRNSQHQKLDHDNEIIEPSLAEPVILFSNIPTRRIQQIIGVYKSNGKWPIFAVITPTSLEMTLSCLLQHLLDDRNKEMTYKNRNAKTL